MKELIEAIKDKKFLFFAAAASVIFIVAVLITAIVIIKKPINPVVPVAPKEKTMEDLVNDLTASTDEKKLKPFPVEDIESLTATVNYDENLNAGAKNNKAENPVLVPIQEDDIKSLTTPIK